MRELRSAANALFWFALFCLGWALVVPPPEGTGKGHRPRFLRMVIEDTGHGGRTERVRINVPWFLFRSGLHAVSAAKIEHEADLRLHDPVGIDVVREVWKELSENPEGTEVTRTIEDQEVTFRKEKGEIHLTVRESPEVEGVTARKLVTMRFPSRYMEAAISGDEDLDIEALFDEMKDASRGDVLEVRSDDAHIRVVID